MKPSNIENFIHSAVFLLDLGRRLANLLGELEQKQPIQKQKQRQNPVSQYFCSRSIGGEMGWKD
jgi:hypothetical protein